MNLFVKSDFDKETGGQYIDVIFHDPNRTVLEVSVKTKNLDALKGLNMSKLLSANNEINNPKSYQSGVDLQMRLVTNDLPRVDDPIQYATRNDCGVVDPIVFDHAVAVADNVTLNAIYQCLLSGGMTQSQMVDYLATRSMDRDMYLGSSVDARKEMVKNRMDFIENNIENNKDAQRLLVGRPEVLTIASSIMDDCPPFVTFAESFAKSTLPKQVKVDVLRQKDSVGRDVFGIILNNKMGAIEPFVEMLKACGIAGPSAAEIILAKDKYGTSQFAQFASTSDAATLQKLVDQFPDLGITSQLALAMLLVELTKPGHSPAAAFATPRGIEVFIKALKDPKLGINYDHALQYMYEKLMQTNPPPPHLGWLYNQALAQRPLPSPPPLPNQAATT
jgi:hypothetical protein